MHHGIDLRRPLAGVIAVETEMHGERVEHLAPVGDIADQRVDVRAIEWLQVEIENVMALFFSHGTTWRPALPEPPVKTTRLDMSASASSLFPPIQRQEPALCQPVRR